MMTFTSIHVKPDGHVHGDGMDEFGAFEFSLNVTNENFKGEKQYKGKDSKIFWFG